MTVKFDWVTDQIAVAEGFLSPEECANFIGSSENSGFEEAPIVTDKGEQRLVDIRNNDRIILDDKRLAETLWSKANQPFGEVFRNRFFPLGLNERFRFYRYSAGQKFDWHVDGRFTRDADEYSHFTFMVYLNDGYQGGDTVFGRQTPNGVEITQQIKPKVGMALLFQHALLHKGDTVLSGLKYVLRTDVMFKYAVGAY
jgi:predicted 2-oxoglutarate/Fe(II)-dependent dioxygenase YbiX